MSNNSNSNAQTKGIPIFVGYYYDQWVERMRKILVGHGLWEYVVNGYDESNEKMKVENIKNDAKALAYIKRSLSPHILQRIMHASKAKEAWDILMREFKGNPQVPPHNFGSNAPPPPPNSGHNNARPPPPIPITHRPQSSLFPPGSKRATALAALAATMQMTSIGRTAYSGIRSLSSGFQSYEMGSSADHSSQFQDLHDGMGSTVAGSNDLFAYAYDGIGSTVDNGNDLFATTHNAMGSTVDNFSQFQDCGDNDLFATTHDAMGSTVDNFSQYQDCGSNDLFATTHDVVGSSIDNFSQFQDCGSNDLVATTEVLGSTNDQSDQYFQYYANNDSGVYDGMASTSDHFSQLQDYGTSGSYGGSFFDGFSDTF